VADNPAPESGGSSFGFLTRKLGPAPVWLWALLAFGGYYWYTHYGPGASSSAATTAQTGNAPPGAIVVPRSTGVATVPSVVGYQYTAAAAKVTAAGLRPVRAEPDVGKVTSQKPEPGTQLARGSTVTLSGQGASRKKKAPVSRGKQTPVAQPQAAAAPLTAADIYGSSPTATMAGTTYDSGTPATAMEGAYVPAG